MTEINEAPKDTSPAVDGTEPLVKLRGIDKHFGPVQALYEVNLDLPAGQVTGLSGSSNRCPASEMKQPLANMQ